MSLTHRFSKFNQIAKSLLVAVVCALVLFTNAYPALAIGSTPSRPSEGETRLNGILEESQDAIRPENALNAEEVTRKANEGLNEVQGAADIKQMNRPENSRQATSAAEQVQRAFDKAVDKVTGKD
jgi:hypothetical protein